MVIVKTKDDLFHIIHTLCSRRRFTNPLNGWDQQSEQDADDAYYN